MNARPGTLVILTPAFPAGEAETHWVPTQQLFVKTLKSLYPGLDIRVLSFYYPYRQTRYEWQEIPVRAFDGTSRRKTGRPFFYRDVWQELKAIRQEADIVGLFSFWCGECALIGHYFGKRYGIKHFCWLCGGDARASNRLVRFIRPRPEELIAMSDFLVREFEKNHGIRPAYMIPNGIDPGTFPPAPGTPRDIDILGVGSLSRLKRYDLFVEITRALRERFPGIRVVHCGEGEDKERILGMIREAGLENHFELLGEKPHAEALGLMQRAKVFLHTSDYEGFGIVCLEALYAGARVISFSKPLNKEVPHWEVASGVAEMTRMAGEILAQPGLPFSPVLERTMQDTVREVMGLFGQ